VLLASLIRSYPLFKTYTRLDRLRKWKEHEIAKNQKKTGQKKKTLLCAVLQLNDEGKKRPPIPSPSPCFFLFNSLEKNAKCVIFLHPSLNVVVCAVTLSPQRRIQVAASEFSEICSLIHPRPLWSIDRVKMLVIRTHCAIIYRHLFYFEITGPRDCFLIALIDRLTSVLGLLVPSPVALSPPPSADAMHFPFLPNAPQSR
jgi:hypothetical protein